MATIESTELQIEPEVTDTKLESFVRTIEGLAGAAVLLFDVGKTPADPKQKARPARQANIQNTNTSKHRRGGSASRRPCSRRRGDGI